MTINRNLSLLTPNVSASGAVNNAGLTNSSVTIGSTAVSLGATVTTIAGLTSVTSTTFVGALTGNASTATSATTATDLSGGSVSGTTGTFSGNLSFGTGTNGATATPSQLNTGLNYSNGVTRDKCKIYLYNSGTEQYGFSVGSTGDIQHHSNFYHDFYVSNVKVASFSSGGLTTTLASPIVTGTLTAGGGVGTNGQVLTSTGTGVQWATSAGGGGGITTGKAIAMAIVFGG